MIPNEDEMIKKMTEIQQDWMLVMETEVLEWVTAKGQTRLLTCGRRNLSEGKTRRNGSPWSSSPAVLHRTAHDTCYSEDNRKG